MPLHSFETRIVTPARGIRHVIVHIEGFNEEGVPEWYFGHPNGLPSREAIRLCSEADYARITEQCMREMDDLIDTEPDYEGMCASRSAYASLYDYT